MSSDIGRESGIFRHQVSSRRLDLFRKTTYLDSSTDITPVYLTVCIEGVVGLLRTIGLGLSDVLHGEQHTEYFGTISVGDQLEYSTSLAQVSSRSSISGTLQFLDFLTPIFAVSSDGGSRALIARARSTLVYRGSFL